MYTNTTTKSQHTNDNEIKIGSNKEEYITVYGLYHTTHYVKFIFFIP